MRVRRETMSAITQCPICSTCFKVSQAQLDARNGLVRCGHCQAIFNAREHLRETRPSPQLELPIMEPAAAATTSDENLSGQPEEKHEHQDAAATAEIPDASRNATATPAITQPDGRGECAAPDEESHPAHFPHPSPPPHAEEGVNEPLHELPVAKEDAPLTLAQQIILAEGMPERRPLRASRKRAWPWVTGCLLLLTLMLAQAAYFLRIELAARAPDLKPALAAYCRMLNCSIPLPRKIDLVSIESSDLEADPANTSRITLHAALRNNAPYALAYPAIELTFTDTQDKLLARRTFQPADFLRPEDNETQGMPSRREASIRLSLDTGDLRPTGYRLFLYYP